MNFKRFAFALLLVATLVAVVQPHTAAAAPMAGDSYPDTPTWATTTAGVNLRSNPVTGTVLAVVPYQTKLLVQGRNAETTWAYVEYSGIKGWISLSYATLSGGPIANIPIVDGNTGDSGNAGPGGHCDLDKIVSSSPPGDETITEVGGSHWQHLSIWDSGTLEVSFLIRPSVPAERPIVNAVGYVGLWEDVLNTCPDMLSDALAYIRDRPQNHTHLVYELDLVRRTAKVVYNEWGWNPLERYLLLQRFFGDQLKLIS